MVLVLLAAILPAAQPLRTPVLVELFTSEGCSSCPPADAFLARLSKDQPIPGVEIIALEEHVDYWDRLGWKDPFSSASFTARQQRYGDLFRNESIYTPQMVVDGRFEFVGTDTHRGGAAIIEGSRSPKANIQIKPQQAGVFVRVEDLPAIGRSDTAEVWLAVLEDDLSNDVSHGENAGRKLAHRGVVRSLAVIDKADPRRSPAFSGEPAIKIEKAWQPENLRVVVFIQERSGRRVLGAAAAALRP
jgi:hypothetical protein